MSSDLPDTIEELCDRVRRAMWDIPDPVRAPREAFFGIGNLWRIKIPSTCRQAVEYLRGVRLLVDHGLDRPAMAISRSIHECCIRFHYLAFNEAKLPDWFRWQMAHDYHATRETLARYDALGDADEKILEHWRLEIRDIEDFLGEEPDKPEPFWKGTRTMLRDLTSSWDQEAQEALHRQLVADPSDYVHIHVTGQPNLWHILKRSEESFVAIISKAMQLCHEKQLLGQSAAEIEALCYEFRQPGEEPFQT